MSIPNYQSIMLPLLKFVRDGKEHSISDSIDHIINIFNLSEKERNEILPSGQQYVVNNRVSWARTYLKKSGLIEQPKRSFLKITDLGLKVLQENPSEINVKYLERFPQFLKFRNFKKEITNNEHQEKLEISELYTPEENLENLYQKINSDLAQDLLCMVKKNPPMFFEKLVIELLLKMGYGGSFKEAGKAIGQSGDGGIDGMIKEDRLGLDIIYIQAKRWENNIGSPEIRNFVGSLVGQKANKGIFITTSSFTKDALKYIETITHKVILINGEMLTRLMIENEIGVSKVISYDIQKINTDYFVED